MSRVRITRNPDVLSGKPCIGRWPTEIVRVFDCDVARIKAEYPFRTIEEIEAAIAFERSPRRMLERSLWWWRVQLAAVLLGTDADHLTDEGWGEYFGE